MMHYCAFVSQKISVAMSTMTLANSYHLKCPFSVRLSSLLAKLKDTGQLCGCKGNPFFSLNMLVFANDENTLSRLVSHLAVRTHILMERFVSVSLYD